ncbi:MAG: hypothetical protein JWL81_314 [Verrucomicrobiales bacterium]|nr:hypothetical protein [Verrucomicrobiales bacterium]
MKATKSAHFLATIAATLLCLPFHTAKADPYAAEEDAYATAMKYKGMDYLFAPAQSDYAGAGTVVQVRIPVTAGVNYVLIVGKDRAAEDLNVYVMSEQKTLIVKDLRSSVSRAAVAWRSTYTGEATAYVHMVRADALGSYCVLVGRRGAAGFGPGGNEKPAGN